MEYHLQMKVKKKPKLTTMTKNMRRTIATMKIPSTMRIKMIM